jgi:hypothetical protein
MGKSNEMFIRNREETAEDFDWIEVAERDYYSKKYHDDTAREVLNSLFEGFYQQYNAISKINSKKI